MTVNCPSAELLDFYKSKIEQLKNETGAKFDVRTQVMDEESLESTSEETSPQHVDAIISSFSLHLNNDIDSALIKLQSNLRQDGVLLGTIPGSKTLSQLRNAFYMAENERYGGYSQHVHKFPEANFFSNSLNRHKYSMASLATSTLDLQFDDIYELMGALQDWGLGNALKDSASGYQKSLFLAAAAIHQTFYKSKGQSNKISAEFEILSFIGYRPAPNQTKRAMKSFTIESFKEFLDEDLDEEMKKRVKFGSITEDNLDIDFNEPNDKKK